MIFYRFWYVCVFSLLLCIPELVSAQGTEELVWNFKDSKAPVEDSIDSLNEQAENKLLLKKYDDAITLGLQALGLADTLSYQDGKAKSLHILGTAYRFKGNFSQSLNYYLQSARIYGRLNNESSIANVYLDLGILYQKEEAYGKSINYLEQYVNIKSKDGNADQELLSNVLESIAYAYTRLRNFEEAKKRYIQSLEIQQGLGNQARVIYILNRLTHIEKETENYREALNYSTELLAIAEANNEPVDQILHLNNLAFLNKRLGDDRKTLDLLTRSLNLLNTRSPQLTPAQNILLLSNTGVMYTNLKSYSKAKEYFEQSLKIAEKDDIPLEKARTFNYLAGNYYVSGNNTQAFTTVNQAIEIAESLNAREVLTNSYYLLSLIYDRDRNSKRAQFYLQKALAIENELAEKQSQEELALLEKQLEVSKKEDELKKLIAEKEQIKERNLRLAIEAERQAKDLELLRKERDLQEERFLNQQLEKSRVQQLLLLAEQRALNERQKRESEYQKQEAAKQKLIAEKRRIEAEKRRQENEILLKNKKIQQAEIEKEATLRKSFTWIAALVAVMLFLALILLINTRRANRKIRNQNREIEKQNSEIISRNLELQQQREEIMSQRDFIEQQNVDLNEKNQQINDSIRAAKTIQQAILPQDKKIQELFKEHFVIFKPRDIVSGDFYWLSRVDNKTLIAVVDCTGHGVPGAFMAMIGNTLLNEIINESKLVKPSDILETLHDRIVIELQQTESLNQDGMDVCMCLIENGLDQGGSTVTFSGAKRPLYYIYRGQIEEIKGDKKPIGGIIRSKDRHYLQHEIQLPKGATLYLGTDGFEDMPDQNRRKYGKERLKQSLLKYSTLSLEQQGQALLKELEMHTQHVKQRDDITLIGVKI